MPIVREYVAYVRGFSRNAKLYLWSSSLQSLASGVTFVVMNLYLLRIGRGESLLGALVFYSAIAGVIFALPAGRASDRFGRRPALLSSGLVYVGATLVQVIHPVPAVLVPATLVAGAASAVAMVTGGPILVETSTEEDRAHLFGFQFALSMGASVVGSNLGGILPKMFGAIGGGGPDTTFALRATLYVGVALAALSLLPVLPMREKKRGPAPTSATGLLRLNLSDPRLVGRLLLPQILVGLGAGLIMPLQNVFMSRRLGATTAEIGLIFSISSALTAVGALVAPLLARRWGKVRAITASQLVSVPFLAVMGLAPWLWVYGVAALVRSALMNLANPLINNFCLEVVDSHERATVSSLIQIVWNLGWAVSGYAGGWIMQNVSYTLPYAFTLVLYSASIITFFVFFVRYDPPLRRAGVASGPTT